MEHVVIIAADDINKANVQLAPFESSLAPNN